VIPDEFCHLVRCLAGGESGDHGTAIGFGLILTDFPFPLERRNLDLANWNQPFRRRYAEQ
jgi:hypothetical protein